MDGGRGFFSSDAPPANSANAGATRARPVSAGTRLRQKPAAAHQDFFASLGLEARGRTGSSASSSSNRSYNSMTMRPASASASGSASGQGGGSATSSSSGWRPPPIGGLGSHRATPPPPMPSVGSLSVANVNRSVTTTTSSSGSGLSVTSTAATSAAAESKPAQLFSMEDAEDLYSDDGWNCDSPSVLSNPGDEAGKTATMTTTVTAPALDVAAAAAVEVPDDEFAWGDDDDAFVSPVAKAAVPPMQPPPLEMSNAVETSAFETKVGTALPPPPQAPPVAVLSSSFSANIAFESNSFTANAQKPAQEMKSTFEHSRVEAAAPQPPPAASSFTAETTHSTFETKSFPATHMPVQETQSSFEHPPVQSTPPPPPAAVSSSFFSTESTHSAFETTSFTANQAPPQTAPPVETSISKELHQPGEQWNDDWDQQDESVVASAEAIETTETTTVHTTSVTTTTTTTIQTDTLTALPVQLTSPGGAAGEFWGDDDEDELFDHDDHADEEWDETIKNQTSSAQNITFDSVETSHASSTTAAFSGQGTAYSLPSQPLPPAASVGEAPAPAGQGALGASNYSVPGHSEEVKGEMMSQVPELGQGPAAATSVMEPSLMTPPIMQEQAVQLHSDESNQEMKPTTSLDAHSLPFSSAMVEFANQDNDPNVFPEAPRSARFLHTPTGTGGPFGRIPSPRGDDHPNFQDGFSSGVVDTITPDDKQSADNSMAFEGGEKGGGSKSYTESSVRWNARPLHSDGHTQEASDEQASQHADETHHSTRLGQSDEEERDSVVSFSGENSFFPSTGRPSSLYGGSQSSFASHRMYQSSVASTDHDGSSIASYGVSSAGATFGGSERVSEGGAFSDGTVSETPSIVDSSNASTAFGTDFPSVSEGQFSAPGTTIGGSDNASDGEFSDGNASETTSMCESVNTNPRFVSEFSASSGHYVTETVERRDVQESFASSAPEGDSSPAFGDPAPTAAGSMFGGDDSSADANPFASTPSAFPPSQHATDALPVASSFDHPSGDSVQEEGVHSAASLFGATAGADVPNPFSSFGTPSPTPAANAKPIEERELPTSDAGDLFGSGTPSSGFESSFAQPVQHSYSSSYQAHDQNYNQTGRGDYSDSHSSAFSSAQSQFASSSPFDSRSSSNYNSADPFASRNAAQQGFGNAAPSAENVFSGGYNSNSTTTAAGHFGQQSSGTSTSFGGDQSYDQYAQNTTATYSEQGPVGASTVSDRYGHQSAVSGGVHAQDTANAFGGLSYGQASGGVAGSGALGHFSRQSSASSFTSNTAQSAFGTQNRYSSQTPAPGTPDNYSRQSATAAFASPSPARRAYSSEHDNPYGSQQFGQRSAPGTPDNYSHQSAAGVFGGASPAQRSYSGHQDYSHQGQNAGPVGGFGDHTRSSSSASTDAFFGRSAAPGTGVSSTASDFGGERVTTPSSGGVHHQPSAQVTQPSFSRSGSNVSSYSQQHGSHISTAAAMRSSAQSYDLNTSYGSVESTSLSRHASNSSMNRYGNDTFQGQRNLQQHEESTSSRPQVDASSFFGGASSATTEATASSFFGNTPSQDSQPPQPHETSDSSHSDVHAAGQVAPPQQQEYDQRQQYSGVESSHQESSDEHFGASSAASPPPATQAIPNAAESTGSTNEMPPAPPSDRMQQHESSNLGGSMSGTTDFNAPEQEASPFASEQDASGPQAFDGFGDSGSQGFGGQASSNFFSSSPAPTPQANAASSLYQSERNQEQQQVHGAAAASLQFAEAHPSYQHTSAGGVGASYGESGVQAPAARSGSYFDSGVPGAGASSPANYSRHQAQQPQQQQQYYQYQHQQQEPQHHAATGYGCYGTEGQTQSQAMGYNTASQHGYGATAGRGFITQSASHPVATPVVKTSNKYKDPCVAPPSCLASFGFGGNVVTMFPKRKLRLNIAGSGYRNSPRGAPPPSEFDNGGNGELRKGPVNMYHMDQLHPKDKEFEQMDMFPGPLTEDVSDEAILEYLDDVLKRSETPTSAAEVEDENGRLLLGVLRVLVKCNGKLRSDPGTLNPSDPNSPEVQLIALLSESSRRRSGNQDPTFPAPRNVPSTKHPDLILKHANELRGLLLVGDRKGAISAAMTAHMWPEAMLIASFTDKEEYRRVLRTYLEETYATGDPCRALFLSFADQQEKCVQEPKRLLQTNVQQPAESLILSGWVSHAQVLLANRTADTNKILTELGDRLWSEANTVAAAHVCYLLAGIQMEAPMPSSKMALLGGDHRTPSEARFYVSPGAVQRTEIYEWAQKHSKGASANLMIPFQGYKLIYAMLLADHGKLETAFKYVTSMLTVIKAVTATMKPGTSMYLEGMKNQLTVLDDRLRQHLGQDRVASVAASTSRGGGRKQGGKWGLGSALSMMGKIVNRVVEGNDSATAVPAGPSATTPGGLYANEATPPAASYPSAPSVTAPTTSPAPSYPQHLAQQTPPTSSHGPSPVPAGSYGHATPPVSQGSAPGSSSGYNRTSAAPPAGPYSRPGVNGIPSSGPFSGNGRLDPQQQQPLSGNGRPGSSGPFSNNGPGSQKHGAVPLMRSQHSMEPPGSNHSNHSSSGFNAMPPAPMNNAPQYPQQQQQPPSSQTSQHSQDTPTARPSFQKPAPLELSDDISSASQPKTLAAGLASEVTASLPPADAAAMSGPSSDKGKASPKFKAVKKPGRSKTPPPSGSSKGSGWLSGLSSFIATKMNPEAKVAKLGEQMEAYFDEATQRWVFPGETASEEPTMPSAPPTGPLPGSAPASHATGVPPTGTNSAPGSIRGGPAPSDDPLAALMAPPPSHMLMKKDPLAAMMAPPSRPGMYGGARRGGSTAQRKPPRPQFAVFKPSAASAAAPDEQNE